MEYVYAALLLHKLKQDINEDNVKNVIKATGVSPDDVKVKSLVAAISEVNIEDALKAAPIAAAPAAATAAAAPSSSNAGAAADQEDEKKDEKKEEEALEGLSSLFG
jgi:large subunit ribosomal protein L12